MPKLCIDDFITCFRKQFIFQTGRSGRRISKYYTAENREQGLKTNTLAIMVFIYTGIHYGFNDEDLRCELKIKRSLYDVLKSEVFCIIQHGHEDHVLQKKVICKIGLVQNIVRYSSGL